MQGFAQLAAHRTARGVSVIEACTVLAIASVLVGAAVPSLERTKQTVALQGLATELATDLRYVRSEAVTRNEGVRVSFRTVSGGTCTLIHTGASADCQCGADGVAHCVNGASLLKSVFHPTASGLTVTANVASMRFDPTNGSVTPTGTVTVTNPNGQSLQHVVNIMGRVRTCSPGGAITGVKAC